MKNVKNKHVSFQNISQTTLQIEVGLPQNSGCHFFRMRRHTLDDEATVEVSICNETKT